MLRALSVWNPWAWALVTTVPMMGGRPLKTVENRGRVLEDPKRGTTRRTGKLWEKQHNVWTLIHTGLHAPEQDAVESVEAMAASLFVEMPEWAKRSSQCVDVDGKRVGALVGAVVFVDCLTPEEVPEGYDRVWVNEEAGHCWMVERAVAFDRHIPCPGFHGFFTPPSEAFVLAEAELRTRT